MKIYSAAISSSSDRKNHFSIFLNLLRLSYLSVKVLNHLLKANSIPTIGVNGWLNHTNGELPKLLQNHRMKRILLLISLFLLNKTFAQPGTNKLNDKYVLVIHGGAGTILKSLMTAEREKSYTEALNKAIQIGNDLLRNGGSALDVAIMDGKSPGAGTVAGVTINRNPISAARAVMEKVHSDDDR
jgi:hypothetical protein